MREKIRESLSEKLEELALKIPMQSNCAWLWGEVEMPECLKKHIEGEKQDSAN